MSISSMLLVRLLVFTLLAPGFVAVVAPAWLRRGKPMPWDLWSSTGWPVLAAGAVLYVWAATEFYRRGRGTPAVFFTRRLRFLIGEEPAKPVFNGLYGVSRNPMYSGIVLIVTGQGLLWRSVPVLIYAAALWLLFHLVVVFVEEPHLREKGGAGYEAYCRSVPRWLGKPQQARSTSGS